MTLIKYRDRDFDNVVPRTFSEMLDTFFDESLTNVRRGQFVPTVDVVENDKNFNIHVSLPGIRKEDIKIEFEDRTLTISGEREFHRDEEKNRYHLVESRYGKFTRSFSLPRNINRETINAEMKDGILNITVEKSEDAVSRQIEIK